MKKIFTSAFVFALVIIKVNAQSGTSYSIKIIPQLSFLQSNFNNSRTDASAALKAAFGIGVAHDFTNHFGIGTDVLYSLQGQRYRTGGKEYNQKNDYVKVPIFFIYNTNSAKPISFIAKVGEQLTFNTNSNLNEGDGDKISADTKDHKYTATFGGMASAGTQYRLKDGLFLTTTLRFDYDFNTTEDYALSGYDYESTNPYTTAGVEVGLKFMFK